MSGSEAWGLVKQCFSKWSADRVPKLAAALAYYTAFSLAPLLVIAIAVASVVLGGEAARQQVGQQLKGFVGEQGGQAIAAMIAHTNQRGGGLTATILGIVGVLLGATGAFAEMKDSLNLIWQVKAKASGVWRMILARAMDLGLVFLIGLLLLASVAANAAVGGISHWVGPAGQIVGRVLAFVVSFGVLTVLFAMLFKLLPDAEVAWRDVWVGATVTSLLFVIGELLISLYLSHSATGSVFGAAGSLAILLLWIYYSAQILYFGAELTQVYANRFGTHVTPAPYAEATGPEARPEQRRPGQAA